MSGPKLIPLDVHLDARGSLFEVFHCYDLPPECDPFHGQVYVVKSPTRGTIRGFHRHEVLWDFFSVLHGRAQVVLVKLKAGEPLVADEVKTFVLCEEQPALLVVPPGFYHGWEALVDDTILLSIGSELYIRQQPDEERIPFDAFGDVWGIKPR